MKLKGGVKLSTFAPERVAPDRQRETERDTDPHGGLASAHALTFEEKMAKR